ncbi:MAG: hypothetical protein JSW35_10170 [Deltaproteobacteria bacterium]|nr:MAG: hypothetical protein JSW35_10170 [Deltaproteobacteria bacterium]
MAILPCMAYAGTEIEKCSEKRDNGYWRCDEWAEEWYYKSCGWQPCKFFCHVLIWMAKWVGKGYHCTAHKVCIAWKLPKVLICVLYAWSLSIARLFGKMLGLDILATVNPTSPFGPAVAYGGYIDERGEETSRPVIMCWTETGDPKTGSSGLRLRYEQLRHYSSPFHNMLPQFNTKSVDGEVSHRGPALTFFYNRFFLAWTGKEPEHRLNVMQSLDGGDTWSKKITLKFSSTSAPALAVFKNRVYLAWRTKPREGSYLKIMSSADGIVWENETKLAARAESGPALASFGSLLFIAWNGKDTYKLNVKSSKDGISFENQVTLQETTDARPALCAYGGQLYLAWKEKGHEGFIKIQRSKDGTNWKPVSVSLLPSWPLNTGKPALASTDSGLIIGWANPNLHIAGRK